MRMLTPIGFPTPPSVATLRQRWRRKSEHDDEWKLGPLIGPEEGP